MDDRLLLGRRVRELRNSQGLSQEGLAEKAGMNWKYLSSVERGKENPTLDLLIRLKKALKVEIVDLFNYSQLKVNEPQLRKKFRVQTS